MRILIVEDEPQISKHLVKGLTKNGYAVDHCANGKLALENLQANNYDCVLLDLNLPDVDGNEIAKSIREDGSTPILMLTARSSQPEIIEGFEHGADDYLTKPFDFQELLLRINALIKRSKQQPRLNIKVANLVFDQINRSVQLDDKPVDLNNKELGMLEYLLTNRGRVISQEELLEHVWDREVDLFTDSVRTNLKTLRQKIDPNKSLIQTIRGRGYVIN